MGREEEERREGKGTGPPIVFSLGGPAPDRPMTF
jgi:hypothetical protein